MLITILMPFKNAAPWISETVDSILSQSFHDWELICIDDHSIDNGAEIIRTIDDSRIRVLENSGDGIITALQLGLSEAQGEYITRMDADDLMTPNRLELMLEKMYDAKEKTIVTGKVKYISEGELSEGFLKYEHWINERIEKNDYFDHIYRECVVASPNWLARREDLIQDRIFEDLHYPEDYDMVFQWMKNHYSIKAVDEVTLLWRDHPNRTSKNSDVYNQQALFRLKLDWFLQLNDLSTNSLAIFGAGTKGKITARYLQEHSVKFNWYDVNHSNYSTLDGIEIQNPENTTESIVLICVYPDNREALENMLESKGYIIGKNAWYL
ncbi:MAG: glycosyltransferase family 2 protein [Crocinitomicaceae bacterium]|nr:glycosyltransferase family 2 protein [Crocinitomicaceae bacterium]